MDSFFFTVPKLRALRAKEYNEGLAKKPDDDAECLTRLFGCAKEKNVKRSRMLFSDMFMVNGEDLRKRGIQSFTEVKFENSIDRATAVANPRQIERVIQGTRFALDMMYDITYHKGQEQYAAQQMRKKDLYVFKAGSCFLTRFCGGVYDVSGRGGSHPVYRYAKPLFMGL